MAPLPAEISIQTNDPDERFIIFGTIQKTYTSLCSEIRSLSNPVSVDFFAVAGNIEDHATNAPFAIMQLERIVDNLYYILGMELLHASQAIVLQTQKNPKNPNFKLGRATKTLYCAYRKKVPFLNEDRQLTPDIQKSYEFLKQFSFSRKSFPYCSVYDELSRNSRKSLLTC